MPSRRCRFCLALQGDAVFADFDVDAEGCVVLCRISFDGFGCCTTHETINPMSGDDSRLLLEAVARNAVDDPRIESLLLAYFRQNTHAIWPDALTEHGLL